MTTERYQLMDEIRGVLNRHSRENESDTPDYQLAEFMLSCLEAFERTVRHREQWYGRECPKPRETAVEAKASS